MASRLSRNHYYCMRQMRPEMCLMCGCTHVHVLGIDETDYVLSAVQATCTSSGYLVALADAAQHSRTPSSVLSAFRATPSLALYVGGWRLLDYYEAKGC